MIHQWTAMGAIVGGLVCAITGVLIAAGNLGWFGVGRDANGRAVWLGVGLGLVVLGFTVQHGRDIYRRGALGRGVARTSIAAIVLLLLSRVLEFAILGTLATFAAILLFTLLVRKERLLSRRDVVLLALATVASITWNTETASAALLIIVGLVATRISYCALLPGQWRVSRLERRGE